MINLSIMTEKNSNETETNASVDAFVNYLFQFSFLQIYLNSSSSIQGIWNIRNMHQKYEYLWCLCLIHLGSLSDLAQVEPYKFSILNNK